MIRLTVFPSIICLSLLILTQQPLQAEEKPERTLFEILFKRDKSPKAACGVKYDPKMIEAADIAEQRARARSIKRCWRYVKRALVAADVVDRYPGTAYAKSAGNELRRNHGFQRIAVDCPFKAPVGSILVYGGRGPGHVEIRTETGFVSDYASHKPSPRPLIGVYVKPVQDRG